MLTDLKARNREQRAACLASFLGWTLDAFDFFLLVFVVKAIADEFHTAITEVTSPSCLRSRCGRSARWCSGGSPTASAASRF